MRIDKKMARGLEIGQYLRNENIMYADVDGNSISAVEKISEKIDGGYRTDVITYDDDDDNEIKCDTKTVTYDDLVSCKYEI